MHCSTRAGMDVGNPVESVDRADHLVYLDDQRAGAFDAADAVAAGMVAPDMVDAHRGGSDEQQGSGVGKPALDVREAQTPDQVFEIGLGQLDDMGVLVVRGSRLA